MSRGRAAVLEKRQRLVEQADRERDELSRVTDRWRKPLSVVDRGLAIARGIRQSAPVLGLAAGVGMAALAILRPRGLGEWVRRGREAWQALDAGRKAIKRRRTAEAQATPSPGPGTTPATASPGTGEAGAGSK